MPSRSAATTAEICPPAPSSACELIGDDELDAAFFGERFEPARRFGRGAEFRAAVHDHHARGDAGQRERPVDRRIAAAGDDHALAAQFLAPRHQVEDASALECLDVGDGRAVRSEGAHAGGDDDGAGLDRDSARREPEPAAGKRLEPLHRRAEVERRPERRRLLGEPVDEVGRVDLGIARNVVDRLLRIERGALPARPVEHVEDGRAHAEHAALEHREKPHRPGADDRHVGAFRTLGHGRTMTARRARGNGAILVAEARRSVLETSA